MRSRASNCASSTSKMDDGKRKTLSEATYKLRKAKLLVNSPSFITAPTLLWLCPLIVWIQGCDKRGAFPGDCATGRHHALWSRVYTEMHANDELLRIGGDGKERANYADDGDRGKDVAFRFWWNCFCVFFPVKVSQLLSQLWSLLFQMFLSSNCRPHHSPPPPHDHYPHQQTQMSPPCASHTQDFPINKETAKSLLNLAQWNAGICPKPVRTPVPRLSADALRVSRRSHRSAASKWSHFLCSSGQNLM